MVNIKKIFSIILALMLVFSISVTIASASFLSKIASALDFSKFIGISDAPELSFSSIVENVKKGFEGTGIIYERDYDVKVVGKTEFGYRIHFIQPTTGKTLYDNYFYYNVETKKWIREKNWAFPSTPSFTDFSPKQIVANIYQAVYDSGVTFIADSDVIVTRTSADGYKNRIVDPFTGKVLVNKVMRIEGVKPITLEFEYDSTSAEGTFLGDVVNAYYPDGVAFIVS
ncbi:MAG: hypothetical protein GX241_04505 [Ruminococcaceae bacterium]|nr:hypothetical protein [Oscillospiraceae bacterium]